MKLPQLKKVTISADGIKALFDAQPPTEVKGTAKQQLAALNHLFDLVNELFAQPTTTLELTWACPKCGKVHELSGEDVRSRALFVLMAYFDAIFQEYTSSPGVSRPPKAFHVPTARQFLHSIRKDSSETSWLHAYCAIYFVAMSVLFIIDIFKSGPLPQQAAEVEGSGHEAMYSLSDYAEHLSSRTNKVIGRRLLNGTLSYAATVYGRHSLGSGQVRAGPFSSIRTSELSRLARRDAKMIAKYGKKKVEKVFEQQLSVLLQSLGLIVVPTMIGDTSVDLVCISGGDDGVTFLVDGKTTAKPYHLPKSDSRALADYVEDTKKTLTTLPKLKFALIVGPSHSGTLERKITELQSSAGLPIRFMKAEQLANLREQMPGPLPVSVFTKVILDCGPIVQDQCIDTVVASYQSQQLAHRTLVENLRVASAGGKPMQEWIGHSHSKH